MLMVVVLLAILLLAPVGAPAEAFPDPPLCPPQGGDEGGPMPAPQAHSLPAPQAHFLPAASAWMGFRHFLPGPGSEMHSHGLDLGADFVLYKRDTFSIEGTARQSLLTRLHPDGQWLFWPAAIYTDLGLRLRAEIRPITLAFWYRHDCKHDIETNYGRDAVHDCVGASASLGQLAWRWGESRIGAELSARAGCEIFFPPIFQAVDAEPDRFKAFALLDWEPLVVPGMPSVFLQGGATLLYRITDTRVTVTEPWALDWSVLAGFRTARQTELGTGRLGLYVKVERVNDDWMSLAPRPLLLASAGILLQR